MKLLRAACLLAAVLLSRSVALARDVHDITTGVPHATGTVVIDIIDKATNKLIKTTTHVPAGITPEEKATLIAADIVAGITAAAPPMNAQFTCTVTGSVITVKNKAKGGTTVKVIWDDTDERGELRVYPDGLSWWQRWIRWFRTWPTSLGQAIVPAGASARVDFDSIVGFQSRTITGDGVKTADQLQAELTASLESAGFTFTTSLVTDPVAGDRWEFVSQPIATMSPTMTFPSFQVVTNDGWTRFFGTMGLEIAPGEIGTQYCFGDGSTPTPCPCGNFGAPGHGCNNSQNTGGSRLEAVGTTNPDEVVLVATNELPNALTIFLQGNATLSSGAPFGDGVRCVGGSLKRLYAHSAQNGQASAPYWDELSITQRSAQLGDTIAPGATRFYQAYYRDPNPNFCPAPQGNAWNVSNAVQIAWM